MKNSLLIEILVEYMPRDVIEQYINYVRGRFVTLLETYSIKAKILDIFFTNCRIVINCDGLELDRKEDENIVLGPPLKQAYNKDGSPSGNLLGFLEKWDKEVNDVVKPIVKDNKEYVGIKVEEDRFLKNLFIEQLPKILESAKLSKSMRWEENNIVFSRPVRNLLAIFSNDVLPVNIFGLPATASTFDNLKTLKPLKIKKSNFNTYRNIMKKNNIYIDQKERKEIILEALKKIQQGFCYKEEDLYLIEEWVYECDNPVLEVIDFDPVYLQLPNIFIAHILKSKLHLLPLYSENNEMVNKTVFCLNKSEDTIEITRGLKEVISAKLEDLKFYWQNDLSNDMGTLRIRLKDVVFPRFIGSISNKLEKIVGLCDVLLEFLKREDIIDKERIKEVLEYFKLDYVTQTFSEYPELEGYIIYELLRSKMGKLYNNEFFSRILESYKPRNLNDIISQNRESLCISFLDKLDDMVSFILNGFKPKSQEDPFFVRKKTSLVIYILHSSFLNTLPVKDFLKRVCDFYRSFYEEKLFAERPLDKSYEEVFCNTVGNIFKSKTNTETWFNNELWQYFVDRYRNFLVDKGYKESIVKLTLQSQWVTFKDVKCTIESIDMMEGLPFWQTLFEVINRTKRIISNEAKEYIFKKELLQHAAEKELYRVHSEFYASWKDRKLENTTDRLEFAKRFAEVYSSVLHTFFEEVFVETEDKDLQLNRKNLLYQINKFFVDMIADISLLQYRKA